MSIAFVPGSRIAVIGAGISGLTCASHLRANGYNPVVFEKSRGLGGRLATRRADVFAFDHGAQYLTARSTTFENLIAEAIGAGVAADWRPRVSGAQKTPPNWIVGAPTMNAFVEPLARNLNTQFGVTITGLESEADGWRVKTQSDQTGTVFDAVVCTIPAVQAERLLSAETEIADALARVKIAPCWALMVTFPAAIEPGFDVWRSERGDIAWMARNASKPGRKQESECWVVHAGSDWSIQNLGLDKNEITALLLDQLPGAFGNALPLISHVAAHRWRYAKTTTALGTPFLRSNNGRLFLGGDWCLGARIECGFESGLAIAKTIVARTR